MDILYLNAKDIEQIALTDAEIIGAIEDSLRAQGNGQTSIEPEYISIPTPRITDISTCCAATSHPSMWQVLRW